MDAIVAAALMVAGCVDCDSCRGCGFRDGHAIPNQWELSRFYYFPDIYYYSLLPLPKA